MQDIIDPAIFGIAATLILVGTLIAQTVKQWRERVTKGVSRWFFLGQVSASVCFIIYSAMIGSVLFTITNALILASAFAGYVVLRLNRRRARSAQPAAQEAQR